LKGDKLFRVEWDDLDVFVIYFVVLTVFFHVLLLEILDYKVSVIIFQIVENYGEEKLIAAAMCPGRFQLEITIVTAWKEELAREVIVMTDFPVTVIK